MEYHRHRLEFTSPLPGDNAIPGLVPRDGDPIIKDMISEVIHHPASLRETFHASFSGKFVGGGNWLEIDNIVGYGSVRFPPRVEGRVVANRDEGGNVVNGVTKKHQGISTQAAEAWRIELDDGCIDMSGYGHQLSVNSVDQIFSTREKVDTHPQLMIGEWNNVAELAVTMGICIYNTFNSEDSEKVKERRRNSPIDRIERSCILRRGFEEMKSKMSISDGIVQPRIGAPNNVDGEDIPLWDLWVYGSGSNAGARYFCESFCGGGNLKYSWAINMQDRKRGTWTGIRTSENMWLNRGVSNFTPGYSATCPLKRVGENGSWRYGQYHQELVDPHEDVSLEQHLMKLDWEVLYASTTLQDTSTAQEVKEGVCWVVHSTQTGRLALTQGWRGNIALYSVDNVTWGWGVKSAYKFWDTEIFATTGLRMTAMQLMDSLTVIAGLVLLTPFGVNPAITTKTNRLYKVK